MKLRNFLPLSLTLISASAQQSKLLQIEKIPAGVIITENNVPAVPSNLPPSAQPRVPQTPEQQRSRMLQTMAIDRSPSGILTARLAEKNEATKPPVPEPPGVPEVPPPCVPRPSNSQEIGLRHYRW